MGEKKYTFEPLVTSKEVMALLNMAPDELKDARDNRGLPYYPISKVKYKYRLSEVDQWLKERKKING